MKITKVDNKHTVDILVAKKCQYCNQPIYVYRKDDDITFTNCEPCIIDIRLEKVSNSELAIKGRRSQTSVRCLSCKHRHLLKSFEEVKDGISKAQTDNG